MATARIIEAEFTDGRLRWMIVVGSDDAPSMSSGWYDSLKKAEADARLLGADEVVLVPCRADPSLPLQRPAA